MNCKHEVIKDLVMGPLAFVIYAFCSAALPAVFFSVFWNEPLLGAAVGLCFAWAIPLLIYMIRSAESEAEREQKQENSKTGDYEHPERPFNKE